MQKRFFISTTSNIMASAFALFSHNAYAIAECSVNTAPVMFGTYTYTNIASTQITGNVQVSCSLLGLISLLVNYEILLSPGNSGNFTSRKMLGGAYGLHYNLYLNPGRTIIWGNGSSGTDKITDGYLLDIGHSVRNYSIYGRISANQNIPSGSYSDSIIVTINY